MNSKKSFKYTAYGFNLSSAIPLPELSAVDEGGDVEIKFGTLSHSREIDPSLYLESWITNQGTFVFWRNVATFLIRNGNEIIVEPVPGVEEKRLRLILLGAVISVLLEQRGYFVFHASAVTLKDNGVIFIGNKGWGKSTMAAFLHSRGHNCMADDVVAIDDFSTEIPRIQPSFPFLKLWPDAVETIGDDPDNYPLVSSLIDKRGHFLKSGFYADSVPLKAIFALGVAEKENASIQSIESHQAVVELIRHTYSTRWGNQFFARSNAENFVRASKLAKRVPMFRLLRPKSLDLLPRISVLLENHFQL